VLGDVGRRVAEIRRELGWTQAVLAEHLGVTVNYVKNVEAGKENLTVRSLVRVANLVGVDVSALFEAPASRLARRPGRPKRTA
jgi:transcriptional regulator with XRE-family HTH domain